MYLGKSVKTNTALHIQLFFKLFIVKVFHIWENALRFLNSYATNETKRLVFEMGKKETV